MDERQAQLCIAWGIVLAIVVWSYVWTLVALWKAARRDHLGWYVVLAILIFPGLLQMLYVFFVAPRQAEMGDRGEYG